MFSQENKNSLSSEGSGIVQKTFQDFLADKTSPIVYCTLFLDGASFLSKNSYSVELHQRTNEHDTFSIMVPDDALDSFEGYVMEHSRELLGKKVSLQFHRYGALRQTFTGIISHIRNKKDEGGGYGKLYITGHSPSILLENGKDCQSYEHFNLEQIITAATAEYSEAKVKVFNPNTKYAIPYTVQYKESDYQFIKRLACRYGEYFYYDGQELIFGNKVQPVVKLGESIDLIDIEFELMVKPQSFKYMSYDSVSAEVKEQDADGVETQYKQNIFQSTAIKASKAVFKKKSEMLFTGTSHQNVRKDLEEMVRREKESREHLMQVRGRSRDPELRMGSLAEISDINGRAMETYRIIEISHYHDGNEYYNEFVGVPDVFISPFFDEDAFPECEEQSAIVMQNDDPQGRVRVQFAWQRKKNLLSPWLRVVTPYAGKGKGMHIIPEVGEEVMVGFDNGNAERPFVIGAMFNGMEMSGYAGEGNKIKAIHTRSGHILKFTEDESIILTDKSGNEIKLDTEGGNINITAPSSINITAGKSVNINAGEDISISAGMNINTSATMNYTQMVGINYISTIAGNASHFITGKLMEMIDGDVHSETKKGKTIYNSEGGLETSSLGTIFRFAEKEIRHNSEEKSNNH